MGLTAAVVAWCALALWHLGEYGRCVRSAAAGTPRSEWRYWLAAGALGALYLAGAVTIAYRAQTFWPDAGGFHAIGLLILLCGVLFHALLGAWRLGLKRLPRRRWRWLVRLLAIALAVPAMRFANPQIQARQVAHFTREAAPLVEAIDGHADRRCEVFPQAIEALPPRARHGTLYVEGPRYVIRFPADTMDVDGGTLFFDSRTREWSVFHHDDTARAVRFDRAIEGFTRCPAERDAS